MIYISTSSLGEGNISDCVKKLRKTGFVNIELSGGFNYCENLKSELLLLREKLGINYLCHNYFPPPKEPFVLNLASLNDFIYQRTLAQLKESLELTKDLGLSKFSFHAGYYFDIAEDEIGRNLSHNTLFDREKSRKRFIKGVEQLQRWSDGVELYIENNVISYSNFNTFHNINPLMLTNSEEYKELKNEIDFKLLLDIAHLKVSAGTLGLDFEEEMDQLMPLADYLHLSDNDGKSDQNFPLKRESDLHRVLEKFKLNDKVITLEMNGEEEETLLSRSLITELIDN